MVIIGDRTDSDVKGDSLSVMTNCCQLTDILQSDKYVPEEIWFEILSRLPIKSLFITGSVCKLWRDVIPALQIKWGTDPMYIPLCGLLIVSIAPHVVPTTMDFRCSYFCLRTKENFVMRPDSPENSLIYASGFKRGLMSDLSFDFSRIHKFLRDALEKPYFSFCLHRGLLHIVQTDGSSQVHNPATKQTYFVPKSPIVEKHHFVYHATAEYRGLLIQFPSYLNGRCHFNVVRFCGNAKIIEVYCSVSRTWARLALEMEGLVSCISSRRVTVRINHYVSMAENGVSSLYFLTSIDCGIIVKFKCPGNSKTWCYTFPLPKLVLEEYRHARIWECEKTLYLTYYTDTGLWIWKAGCTDVDAWEWVPMLEISPAGQLCKPVARGYLSKVVLDADVCVRPLTCHPNVSVVYLLIKSSMFAYNLDKDTLDKVGEMKYHENRMLSLVYTYKPCLGFIGFMDAA